MRLLLATDGSACASTAAELVAGTRWPADITVDVLRVIDPIPSTWAFAPVPDLQATHEQLRAEALDAVNETAAQLRRHGLRSTATVLLGPEAPTIVHRATTTDATMIVCGSRGTRTSPLRAARIGIGGGRRQRWVLGPRRPSPDGEQRGPRRRRVCERDGRGASRHEPADVRGTDT